MNRNSTIKQKVGQCSICLSKGDELSRPLIKGMCQMHYQMDRARACEERKQNRTQSGRTKKVTFREPLSDLIDDADAVFSKYIRWKYADENGFLFCYTSGEWMHVSEAQCGHFISRSCYYLRWDERNCRPQSGKDNVARNGNLTVFAQKLNEENPGIVDILEEESHISFKPGSDDLRAIISEYTEKLEKIKR